MDEKPAENFPPVSYARFRHSLALVSAIPNLEGEYLFHFNLTGNRRKIAVDDPLLQDRVADNLAKHEITESESLLIGSNFGVVTLEWVQTGISFAFH